jgi:hypothetical protein
VEQKCGFAFHFFDPGKNYEKAPASILFPEKVSRETYYEKKLADMYLFICSSGYAEKTQSF